MRNVILAAILAASAGSLTLVGPAAAETAIFAGGCFWCMEEAFDKAPGVSATISGYSGGSVENPTYEQVSSGGTGHFEVVQVEYDPAAVSYEELLDVFWHNVDPLDPIGQFCDKGSQYLSAFIRALPSGRISRSYCYARRSISANQVGSRTRSQRAVSTEFVKDPVAAMPKPKV